MNDERRVNQIHFLIKMPFRIVIKSRVGKLKNYKSRQRERESNE